MTDYAAWKPATRVAFRFCFLYFSLYIVAGQMLGGMFLLPNFQIPQLGPLPPMRNINEFFARYLFGVDAPYVRGNSGDTLFGWVQTAWMLTAATLGTAIWSVADSRRVEYATLHKWFRLVVRFALAAQMFFFGFAKVIPTQFIPPALTTIVSPVGFLDLASLLWVFVGASTPYQMFTGWAEVAAAVLLVFPRTTLLGALLCAVDMVQVLALNASYDFGLKQISFHYILMALVVAAPDAPRLANLFLFDRPAPASRHLPLFRTPHANRAALIAQVAFGVYLASVFIWLQARQYDAPDGPAHPRSPLYGIWDIERLEIDGRAQPAALNSYDRRWRRAIFDYPDRMGFQRTDDSLARYSTTFDAARQVVVLTKGRSGSYTFRYQRPADDRLVLDGIMDGEAIHIEMALVGLDTWPLLNSTFRWVRPPS
ncbi:MAG: hypothetical protein AB7P99_03695 [Vicinamibacterales bacterium]